MSQSQLESKPPRDSYHSLCRSAQAVLDQWRPITPPQAETFSGNAPIQVLDFFSGCGGMSAGFAAVGKATSSFSVAGGFDLDPSAARTFEANFGVPCAVQDIAELEATPELLDRVLMSMPLYRSDKPLVLIGCAPCQGFTSHRKRSWDQDDSRNDLVATFTSIAVRLRPICIVMENVPEMLSMKYRVHYERAILPLIEAGYTVQQTILNCAAFGVPQERFRTLVVAMRQDFLLPRPLLQEDAYKTVREAISDLPPVTPGGVLDDPMHVCARHRRETIQTIQAVPPDGGSRPVGIGPKCLDRIAGFSDVYGRLSWDRPAITVTHYARNPASGRYVHPEQHRGLTVREAARLQSFPDGFTFVGTFDGIFKQIGEAVPPRFSCAVAAMVHTELHSPPPSTADKASAPASIEEPVSNSFSSVIVGLKSSRRSA